MKQKKYDLNFAWSLISGNDLDGQFFHRDGIPTEQAVSADLPCFTHMYLDHHLGISWYQKKFSLAKLPDEQEVALLCFEQADFSAEVSFNGTVVGKHFGCEDPFFFDVTDFLSLGENRITVRIGKPYEKDVDGYTFGEVPHRNQLVRGLTPGACYNESGISGEVCLKFVPRVRVADLFADADPQSGIITCRMVMQNDFSEKKDTKLRLSVRRFSDDLDVDTFEADAILSPGTEELTLSVTVPEYRLWSPEDPNLYCVTATVLCESSDYSITKRVGFRSFEVRDDGFFYLNGKRIFVRCSHTGNCMPGSVHHISRDPAMLRKDFSMAKAVGFNMIRFISGAALPLQLDLCDELGLMVYEEPVAGWLTQNGSHAAENYFHDLYSMIKRDRSHPCVTVWGLLNETKNEPPYDEVSRAAQFCLPELRKLDPSRLVLFSAGRWDNQLHVGSLSNAGHTDWQTLWGDEDATRGERIAQSLGDFRTVGDVHYYPQAVPFTETEIQHQRNFGALHEKPVFLSEIGVGSVLDTVSLVKRFEQEGFATFLPDVKKIRQMNDILFDEFRKYGFDRHFPFMSEMMRGSMKNHAFYRTVHFDYFRSNPKICGLSLTGLLDHSICGEGLWTLFREYKPMIADVLQDGFAPLRWCIIPEKTCLFRGDPLRVECFLAHEDVLRADYPYTVRYGFRRPDGSYTMQEKTFVWTKEDVHNFSIPVFDETVDTAPFVAGTYQITVELLNGADVAGGTKEVTLMEHTPHCDGRSVTVSGVSDSELQQLIRLGFNVHALEDWNGGTVLAGHVDETNLPLLRNVLAQGGTVIAARANEQGDLGLHLLPEEKRPTVNRRTDWLYRKETVFAPKGMFVNGVPAGVADGALFGVTLNCNAFEATEAQVPDVTDAIAFSTGYCAESGYVGGYKLGLFRLGNGNLIINGFSLLDHFGKIPMAERLLVNLLNYEA